MKKSSGNLPSTHLKIFSKKANIQIIYRNTHHGVIYFIKLDAYYFSNAIINDWHMIY